MRKILMIFVALATLKVWTQDRLYRSVMHDALVQAYRERATVVCQKEALKPAKGMATLAWPSHAAAEVVIGAPGIDVKLWDFDNPMWDVRFRHPHLVLTAPGQASRRCAYDLTAGIANVL